MPSAAVGAWGRGAAVAESVAGNGGASAAAALGAVLDWAAALVGGDIGLELDFCCCLESGSKGASSTTTVDGKAGAVCVVECWVAGGDSAPHSTSRPACNTRISAAAVSLRRSFKACSMGVQYSVTGQA